MSISVSSKVWDDHTVENKCELLIALVLADFADDRGYCYPAVETVARKARCSVRTVQDTIQQLASAGKLTVYLNQGIKGTNLYLLNAWGKDTPANVAPPAIERAPIAPPPPQTGGAGLHPIHQYPLVDPSGSVSTEEGSNKSPRKFVKPTIEEVKLHGAKIGISDTESEKFFYYYESNGWRVGKNPMKSWHGAMQTWKRNVNDRGPSRYGRQQPPPPNHGGGW